MMKFLFMIFISPAIVLVASILGVYVVNNWLLVPCATLVIFIIITKFLFAESFLVWSITYTILSLITVLVLKVTRDDDN
jgi:hypothetical protein